MCKSKRLPSHVRKLNICIAGKELFLIKSFTKTTMEDVAKQAGISKGCLYNYYKNTYDILYDLVAYYKYNIVENISSIINEYGKFNSSIVLAINILDMLFNEKIILKSKLKGFKSYEANSNTEFDITVLDEKDLLKDYVRSFIDKIIVSRTEEIEIVEI